MYAHYVGRPVIDLGGGHELAAGDAAAAFMSGRVDAAVVWNPWIEKAAKLGDLGDSGYLKMVCVESGNIADDAVTIAPGKRHAFQIRYSTRPLV